MNLGRIFWGFLFLLIGILLLGENFHWWDVDIWQTLLSLWPVLLILIGLSIAFGESNPLGIILFITVLILALIYVAKPLKLNDDHTNFNFRVEDNNQETLKTSEYSHPLEENVESAVVNIDIGAAIINVNPYKGSDLLYKGVFNANNDLNATYSIENNIAKVEFKEEFNGFKNFARGNERQFNLNLSDSKPFDLRVNSGASRLDMDLEKLNIRNLSINAGASTQEIKIGSLSDEVRIKIDAGASKISLNLPRDYSLDITNESGLLNNNFKDLALEKSGNTYKSSDFDSSSKKIYLEIKAGASSIKIEQY